MLSQAHYSKKNTNLYVSIKLYNTRGGCKEGDLCTTRWPSWYKIKKLEQLGHLVLCAKRFMLQKRHKM